jgi:DNA primase
MIRSLLEFGNNEWNESDTVATHLFKEIEENELDTMIENKLLLSVLETYKKWHAEDLKPTDKNFIYYDNREISDLVINLMQTDTEISPNWKLRYEGHIPTREELFKEEVFSSLNYLKLRKVKRMIMDNQQEMQEAASSDEQIIFLQTHQHLKQMEILLTKQLGTVIYI